MFLLFFVGLLFCWLVGVVRYFFVDFVVVFIFDASFDVDVSSLTRDDVYCGLFDTCKKKQRKYDLLKSELPLNPQS